MSQAAQKRTFPPPLRGHGRTCARTFEDDHLSRCDHRKAKGPSRTPDASSANNADHPSGRPGPPAASSATPAPQPPSAERPNPTVECSARVAGNGYAVDEDEREQ